MKLCVGCLLHIVYSYTHLRGGSKDKELNGAVKKKAELCLNSAKRGNYNHIFTLYRVFTLDKCLD